MDTEGAALSRIMAETSLNCFYILKSFDKNLQFGKHEKNHTGMEGAALTRIMAQTSFQDFIIFPIGNFDYEKNLSQFPNI